MLNHILVDLAGDVTAADLAKNRFILEVLDIVKFMILQGYYDPRANDTEAVDDAVLLLGPELQALVPPLVSLLDGRGDVGYIGRRERERLDMLQLQELSKPGSSARFALNSHNEIVMSLKTASLKILNDLFGIQASSRLQFALQQLSDQVKIDGPSLDAEHSNGKLKSTEAQEEHAMENPLAVAPLTTFEVEDPLSASTPTETNGRHVDSGTNGGIDTIATADVNMLVAAQRATANALKADKEFQKVSKLFSGKIDERVITAILLDGLRYSQKTDLVLTSFAALYTFRAEHQMFHRFLTEVTILASNADAGLLFTLHQLVTSYQRAVQRLLEKESVMQCITLADAMACHCAQGPANSAATARLLLRNLEIDEHLDIMMRSHPNDVHQGSYFQLLQSTLKLVAALCNDEDAASQFVFAEYMETTIMPLFAGGPAGGDPALAYSERKDIMLLVASVLPKMISGNRRLAISLANMLVSKTVDVMRVFGKHYVLLEVLRVLVQVDGKSVEYAQTQVAKGLIEKTARALDCALDEDEWGDGPALTQNQVLTFALRGDTADDTRNRCQKELKYYCAMLQLMGLCARGLMPHTELQAASMLSFDKVVNRIHNMFLRAELREFQHRDELVEVKRATVLFLNDVFIDSDSEFVSTVVREQANGLWGRHPF